MRKNLIRMVAAAMLLCASTTISAQNSLGGLLGKVASKASSATSGANDVLSGLTTIFSASKVASAADLVGTWNYEEPAVVFTSSNMLKQAGGKVASAAIEKQLKNKLQRYGITKGKMKMTFDSKGNFTQTIAGKTLRGTFTVSGKNVVLKYGGTTKQMIGTTQVDGNDLLIVMDATKLLAYMKTLGTLSGNASLKAASSLLASMDGMQCGLRLKR